jgi:hypothetical protein
MLVVEVEQHKVMEDLLLLVLVELVVEVVVVYPQLLLQQTLDVVDLLILVVVEVELQMIMVQVVVLILVAVVQVSLLQERHQRQELLLEVVQVVQLELQEHLKAI